jgi:hypothetical protein
VVYAVVKAGRHQARRRGGQGEWLRRCLPLHLQHGCPHGVDRHPQQHIVPLFARYLFCLFDPSREQWRRIYRARGIAGLIGATTDRPTPLGIGVVEALIARTSPRRIVDDPGSASFPDPATQRQHWQDMTRLSARARTALMLRLFGRAHELEEAA